MRRTKLADGSPFVFNLGDRAGFTTHDWEIGIGGGDYGGANLINAYGAYSLTDNMKVELTLSQFLGNASNGYKAEAGLTHVMFPGMARVAVPRRSAPASCIEPRATIVLPRRPHGPDRLRGRGRPLLSHPALLRARRLSLAHDLHEPR